MRARFWIALLGTIVSFASMARPAEAAASDCGNGVTLALSSSTEAQGGLMELTVRSAQPLVELKASWAGQNVPFWSDESQESIRRALAGVDLEHAPGKYTLALEGKLAGGEAVACNAVVDVSAGHFAVEKLTLPEKYVDPRADDLERVNREGARLKQIFATITVERLWSGRFRMPLNGDFHGTNFGRRRVLNGEPRSPHTGIDFPAPAGTPVHATQRGRVVLAEELFFSGNTVVIDHGLGVYTLYGHMESLAVHEGDAVERGAVLGRVGATGRATGPHLHWGLTVNQARVNPVDIVRLPSR
jgi:murein DD-endopeptidase MepM/ murein hydrolase activator NlpD